MGPIVLTIVEEPRPGPIADAAAEAGYDGIRGDVSAGLLEVTLIPDDVRGIALRKEVTAPPMALVEASRISPIEVPHRERHVWSPALQEKVVMSPHKTVGVAHELGLDGHRSEQPQEGSPVLVVEKEGEAGYCLGRDVVHTVRQVVARLSRHSAGR